MLNCIIVEDEFPAREELKFFIKNNKNFAIKREFETSIDALKFLENSSVDVVFLDINMPGLDGMTLARLIHKIDKNTCGLMIDLSLIPKESSNVPQHSIKQ